MPSNYEDQIALQGMLISRPESPALEGAAAKAIEDAFKELIERRYFYQKLPVNLEGMDAAVRQAVDAAMRRACTPGAGAARGPVSQPIPASPERLAELRLEIEKRPWRLVTRHLGDNPRFAAIHSVAGLGVQPLETPAHLRARHSRVIVSPRVFPNRPGVSSSAAPGFLCSPICRRWEFVRNLRRRESDIDHWGTCAAGS